MGWSRWCLKTRISNHNLPEKQIVVISSNWPFYLAFSILITISGYYNKPFLTKKSWTEPVFLVCNFVSGISWWYFKVLKLPTSHPVSILILLINFQSKTSAIFWFFSSGHNFIYLWPEKIPLKTWNSWKEQQKSCWCKVW